jgi:hypothetical protein
MRMCPQCMKQIPPSIAAAYSYHVECPNCHASLQVSDGTRIIGAFASLLVGWLVYSATSGPATPVPWLLPEIYSILAYSFTFALYVLVTADMVMRPADVAVPIAASGHAPAHGAHH